MKKIIGIASYMYKHCQDDYGCTISETKLQRLMYLLQREALVQNGEPIFSESFHISEGIPELTLIRFMYDNQKLNVDIDKFLIDKFKNAFHMVFSLYAKKSIWSLNNLTSCECSWKEIEEKKTSFITAEEIKIDAEKIRARREAMHFIRTKDACVVKR